MVKRRSLNPAHAPLAELRKQVFQNPLDFCQKKYSHPLREDGLYAILESDCILYTVSHGRGCY